VLAPAWRLLGIAAAGTAAFLLPVAASAATSPKLHALQAQAASLAHEKRSAVLSLYSLDSRLGASYDRLAALDRREAALRAQRAVLRSELLLAKADTRLSERRLAARVRSLYEHDGTGTLDVLFGATSLSEALTELDNLSSVSSADQQILAQIRTARLRELRAKQELAAREARLTAAIGRARAEAQSLAAVRSERSAYIAGLTSRQALDAQQIAGLQAQARAAETKTRQLTQSGPAAYSATPVAGPVTAAGGVVTVVATGYCLKGTTATGIPVGWGVAAVDPRVIPLGTHLTIPGYGTAVAADTGGAIVGGRVDLWFPTCAQAGGWGTRSVTIALH
jgi:3D (Asp-Asp-Asp) domain-containing protein/peptidoglycan hydrolase CwlO-like protein